MLGLGLGLDKPRGLIYFQNQYSMYFDGSDDKIITDGADTVAQPTTYSFWCKSSTTVTNAGVFGHGAVNIGAFHFNWSNGGILKPFLYLGSNYYVFWDRTTAQDDGEWHHWVVYSEPNNLSNCKLYVDGVLQNTSLIVTAGVLTPYTESLTIGSDRQVGGNCFLGNIDEFAVFDRELTQDEINRMFNTYYTNNLIQNSDFSEIGDEEVTNGDFSQIGNEEVTNGNFQQQSAELVINGDFSSESNWTGINNNGYTISNGLLHLDNTTQFTSLSQNIGASATNIYKVEFTISNYVKGSVKIALGSNGVTVSEDGPQTVYLTPANGTALIISGQGASGTTLDIDNVSVREVGQSWEINSTAIFTDNGINITTGGYIRQDVLTSGKFYQLTYDIISYTSGNIRVYDGTDQGNIPTALGSNTFNFKAGGSLFYIQANSNPVDLVIDNISVKEVGQGFTFGDGWSMGDGIASCDGTQSSASYLLQNLVLPTPNQYLVTFEVSNYASGNVKFGFSSSTSSPFGTARTANGVYTENFTHDSNTIALRFRASDDFVGDIDNITIKQVGQHWTFGTGWSTDGTKAIFDGGSDAALQQSTVVLNNKTYKVIFDVADRTTGSLQLRLGNTGVVDATITTNGTYENSFVSDGTSLYFRAIGGFDGSIDNIVVQELKHQATNLLVNSGDYQSANPLITSTKSMEFDGTDDYLNVGVLPDIFKNANTLSAWVWTDGSSTSQIFSTGQGAFSQIYQVGTALRLQILGGTGYAAVIDADYFSTDYQNKWVYLTLVYNGATIKAYRNGIEVGSAALSGTLNSITQEANIGRWQGGSEYWNGKITEFGLYDRALTSLEVASLYNQGMPTNLLVNRNNYQSGNPTVFNTKQVDFDGTDDYLNAGNVLNLGTSDFSISMWVNSSQTTNRIMGKTQNDANRWYIRSTGNKVQFHSKSGGAVTMNLTTTETFPVDTWAHLLISADRDGTVYIYINGVQSSVTASGSATSLDNTGDLTIGKVTFFDSYFDGKISQVGMWNKALTADEVSSLYNHGLPIDLTTDQAAYSSSSNLVGYWRMGSGTLDTYPLIADQTNATLGSEIIVNGDFASDTWWQKSSANVNISNGKGNYTGGTTEYFYKTNTLEIGKTYKLVFEITDYTTGYISAFGGNWSGPATAVGTWEKYFTCVNTTFGLVGNSFIGSIDNVTVKQVQGNPAMMINLGGGADFSDGIKNGSPYANIVQDSDFTLTGTQAQSTNGTYWDTGAGWTIANNKATSNGTVDNLDGIPLQTGKNYKATVTVSNMTTGNLSYRLGGASSNEILSISSNGEYTVYGVAGGTLLRLRSQNGFDGSVTNITISEVNTGLQGYWKMGDGTNDEYPVIYDQVDPTLGSELITNGDFSTSGTVTETSYSLGWSVSADSVGHVSISDGNLTILNPTGGGGKAYATNGSSSTTVVESGKTYKLTYDVTENTSNTTFYYHTGDDYVAANNTVGSHTVYYTADGTIFLFRNGSTNSTIKLDNVSIKQVQGNPATMTSMPEGNITNQYPLTKIRNYYRMGDGTLDSKFTSYPATAAPFIFQDQTSPNLAHIPTTNILTYSEDFSNSFWTKTDSTVSSGFLSPTGTDNAYKLVASATNGQVRFGVTSSTSNTKAISVFAKANTSTSKLRIVEQNYVGNQTTFDLNLGVIESSNGLASEMENYGNGWYRCTHIQAYSSGQTGVVFGFRSPTIDSLFLWGGQAESQSQATAYIKSDGIAAVRKSSTTNLIPYSEDFTNAAWGKNESEVVLSTITSPLDSSYAYKLQTLNNNNQSYTNVSITTVATNRYTFSAYVKKADYNYVALVGLNPVTVNYFDLVNGTTFGGSTASLTYTNISDAGNGWYRCSVTFIADTTTKFAGIYLSENGTTISLGGVADGKGVYIWGAQLEQQTQAETYAPTKGIPVTIDLFKENNYGTTQGGTIQKDVPRNS